MKLGLAQAQKLSMKRVVANISTSLLFLFDLGSVYMGKNILGARPSALRCIRTRLPLQQEVFEFFLKMMAKNGLN